MSLAGNMKDEDACKGFEAIKVKNRRHNTADEIPDCGSENLRQWTRGLAAFRPLGSCSIHLRYSTFPVVYVV